MHAASYDCKETLIGRLGISDQANFIIIFQRQKQNTEHGTLVRCVLAALMPTKTTTTTTR